MTAPHPMYLIPAERIHALINKQPTTPTVDQIAAVIAGVDRQFVRFASEMDREARKGIVEGLQAIRQRVDNLVMGLLYNMAKEEGEELERQRVRPTLHLEPTSGLAASDVADAVRDLGCAVLAIMREDKGGATA